MKPLHQQLAEKRRHLQQARAEVVAGEGAPQELHAAANAAERLGKEVPVLETDIELGEAAHHQLVTALSNLRTVGSGGRELSLAITEAETAAWRLRNHLGEQPVNREGPPKTD